MKYAVIYARYSSEKQNDQSIEGQLRICNDYAERNDITVVKNYIDRATTGTNDNRPAFQEMLHDCTQPVVWNIVLVYAIDRFGRNSIEIAVNKQKLKKNSKTLISATQRTSENIDGTKNLDGILLENMYIGLAEYYSAELSQKVKRGITESRKKGLFCGGFLPYGYKVVDKKVIVNESEAEIVRYIFKQYACGITAKKLLEEVTEKGILHRGKPFMKNTFYYLLRLEKYTGVCRDRKTGEIYECFPEIVPKDLFYNVQSMMKSNKSGSRSAHTEHLLRKKLFCGYCGGAMQGECGTSQNGDVKRYYKCANRKSNHSCNKETIKKEEIEQLIINTTLQMLTNPENLNMIIDKIASYHQKQTLSKSTYNILIAEREETKKSLQNIIKAVESGLFNTAMKNRMDELEKQLTTLEEKIIAEECNQKNTLSREQILQFIEYALKKEPRIMINLLIQKIIIYDDKIEIFYKYTDKTNPHTPNTECGDLAIAEFNFLYNDGKLINNDNLETNKKSLTQTSLVQIRPMWLLR